MPVVSPSCYELLGVPVDAPEDQLRSAWSKRRSEAQRRLDRLAAEDLEALCARIDEAFQILADPVRAARYRAFREELDGAESDSDETPTLEDVPAAEFPLDEAPTEPGAAAQGDGVELLRHVVQMASMSAVPTQVTDELPPWRQPDAPVMEGQASGLEPELAPAARVPGQPVSERPRAPWDRDSS